MARDWITRNNNQGNVLKTGVHNLLDSDSIDLDCNISVVDVVLSNKNITVTANASKSMVGDICMIVGGNNGVSPFDIILDGDFQSGTVTVPVLEGFSIMTIFNGASFTPTQTPI